MLLRISAWLSYAPWIPWRYALAIEKTPVLVRRRATTSPPSREIIGRRPPIVPRFGEMSDLTVAPQPEGLDLGVRPRRRLLPPPHDDRLAEVPDRRGGRRAPRAVAVPPPGPPARRRQAEVRELGGDEA